MKILHIVSNISVRNGIMSVIMSYYRNMNKDDFSFEFLYFDDREITYKEEIEKLGGKVHKINRSKNIFSFFYDIHTFIKKNALKYQVIHIHEIYLMCTLLGIKNSNKNLKVVAHAHATRFSENKFNDIRNRLVSFNRSITPNNYLACSKAAGIAIFGKKFEKNGQVLNNAINLSKFKEDSKIRNTIRKQLGLENKYVIGHVGNFNQQKNHTFLIDVFYELQKKQKDAVLVLVGDGIKREEILEKCRLLNILEKVIYLGVRNDINNIMNSFDCFVLPSIYEGLGIVLIEAQATGLPCVFTNTVPQEANILTESNTILSLKDELQKWVDAIIKSKNIKIVSSKREICNSGYDIKIEAKKLEKYYKKIVG